MADNIRRPARARMWKRVAIITASVTTLAVATFVVISFLPNGNDAFTIRIDNPGRRVTQNGEESQFHLSNAWGEDGSEDKDAGTLIRGESIDKMSLTTAEEVEAYLANLEKLEGSDNFIVKSDDGTEKHKALVYTIYLVNDDDKPLTIKYSVNVDSYLDRDTEYSIFSYLRVLVQTEIAGSGEINNIYYGQKHNNPKLPYKNTLGNDRECISTWTRDAFKEDSKETVLEPTYFTEYKGEQVGYCYNFNQIDEMNKAIVNDSTTEVVVPQGKALRFTFASYFEGEDYDSFFAQPEDSYVLFSLHFGL